MLPRLLSAVASHCCITAASSPQSTPTTFDVLIRNGRVIDGSGNAVAGAPTSASAAAASPRLARWTRQRRRASSTQRGLTVTPGFIDVHSHASQGLAGALKEARQLLAQGITTVALNPDGGGPIDISSQRAAYERAASGVNVALYVPHGSIRREVLGMADRAPTAGRARSHDRASCATGMEAGAHRPVVRPLLRAGQLREDRRSDRDGEGGRRSWAASTKATSATKPTTTSASSPPCDEVIRVSEEGHLPGIVAHMKALGPASWGLSTTLVERIQQARDRGVKSGRISIRTTRAAPASSAR